MKIATTVMTASLMLLLSTTAQAVTANAVKDTPNGSEVTLEGTVEDFSSEHSFTLHDQSGSIKVDLSATKPIVLKDGEQITVTGHVNHTILGTDVVASDVSEDEGVGKRIGQAIDSATGQDTAGSARTVSIRTLPDSGLVKVTGVVDCISSEKNFKLKDATGSVDVTFMPGKAASLNKGTEVVVVGNVDKGLFGKNISAVEVSVLSDGATTASP